MAFLKWILSDRPLQGSRLRRAWIAGTVAACFLAGTLGTLWIFFRYSPQYMGGGLNHLLFTPVPEFCEVTGPIFCQLEGLWKEAAIAFGILVGLIQQQVLRHWISHRWLWVLFAALGWAGALFTLPLLTYGLFASTISAAFGSFLLIAAGSIMGYIQGALLRSHLPQWKEWWMLQTVMAIVAVLLWSLTVPLLFTTGSLSVLLFAVPVVLIYAVLSGNLLTRLRPALAAGIVEAD